METFTALKKLVKKCKSRIKDQSDADVIFIIKEKGNTVVKKTFHKGTQYQATVNGDGNAIVGKNISNGSDNISISAKSINFTSGNTGFDKIFDLMDKW